MGSVIGAFYELFLWNFKKTSTVSYGTAIGNLCPRAELSFGVGAQFTTATGLTGTEKSRIACSKIRGYYPVEADFIR